MSLSVHAREAIAYVGVRVRVVLRQLERATDSPPPLLCIIAPLPPTPAFCQVFHYTASQQCHWPVRGFGVNPKKLIARDEYFI